MSTGIRVVLAILALSSFSVATSFAPEDHDCPVCGKPSVAMVLGSCSNFGGPPARDRIFQPIDSSVVICPHDLYASWNHRWDEVNDDEKERLRELLKGPVLVLTPEEKAIAGNDLSALRESWWRDLLWARTCDTARLPDAKHSLRTTLDLYYRGDANSDEEWIRRLSAHYRDRAIDAPTGSKELHRRYLRAELEPGAPRLGILRKCGAPWAPWFDQLARDAKAGNLPDGYRDHAKKRSLLSVLRDLGAEGADYSTLPDLSLFDDSLASKPREEIDTTKSDLAGNLAQRSMETASEPDSTFVEIIALLKELPDPIEKPQYGFIEAVKVLAEKSGQSGRLMKAVEGEWASEWWRLACEYALGKSGAGPLLAAHPLTGKKFGDSGKALENIAWGLFAVKHDPIWKEKLMETLRTSPWGNDDIHGYATGLHDEEVDAALDQRTAMLRKNLKPKDRDIMSLFEMRQIERNRSEEKMKVLPIR